MLEIKSRHLTWVGPKSGWDKIERIFGLHFLILFGNKGNITKQVEIYLYLGSFSFWKISLGASCKSQQEKNNSTRKI